MTEAIQSPREGAVDRSGTAERSSPSVEQGESGRTEMDGAQRGAEGPETAVPRVDTADRKAEIATGVEILSRLVLDFDDPVTALEDGIGALAETLAERDRRAAEDAEARHAEQIQADAYRSDVLNALRHARWHRVGELVDLGHGLDSALAIMRANEAEIRARAVAAGRDADEVIYRYAATNGYRPQAAPPQPVSAGDRSTTPEQAGQPQGDFERLAAMSDEDFACATQGGRWHRLHGRPEAF